MGDFIFQVPWWVIALLAGDGVVFFVVGNRRLNDALRNVGVALVVLGIVWAALSYFVDTDLEKVAGSTRGLVKAVVAQDETAIASTLHPNATAGGWNRQDIPPGAAYYAKSLALSGARVMSLTPKRSGRDITEELVVLSEHNGYPVKSVWQLDWQPLSSGEYKLRVITPIEVAGTSRESIEGGYLERPVHR